jgi:3-hydroxybutyrate dehydrogenase
VGLIEKSIKHFGQVDILVNNAALQHVGLIADFPPEKWEAIIKTDLNAVFYTTKTCLAGMKERKWGRIINISSAQGLVASVLKPAYVAAKFGVVGITKATALENAKFGITANAICPGFVHTPFIQAQIDKLAKEKGISEEEANKLFLAEKHPTGEFVYPEDIGALATFLCSVNARQITGATLSIDGGWTAV